MPFSWYHPDISEDVRKTFPEKFERMHLQEIERRAEIFRDLRYNKEYAKFRIRGNIRWGFEPHHAPPFINKVEEIVEKVYSKKPSGGW